MPYIKQEIRSRLDTHIDALAAAVTSEVKEERDLAGTLNYTMTQLVLSVLKQRFGKLRYWMVAAVTGAFVNAKDEFYRRAAAPYEDKKIAEEGDVKLYKEIL